MTTPGAAGTTGAAGTFLRSMSSLPNKLKWENQSNSTPFTKTMVTYSSKRFVLLFLGSTTLSFFMTSILRLSATNKTTHKIIQAIGIILFPINYF
jgi:hypothetical protein